MVALRGSWLWATMCAGGLGGAWNLQLSPQRHMHSERFPNREQLASKVRTAWPQTPWRVSPSTSSRKGRRLHHRQVPRPQGHWCRSLALHPTCSCSKPGSNGQRHGPAAGSEPHTHMRNRPAPTLERPLSPQPPCAVATGTYSSPVPTLSLHPTLSFSTFLSFLLRSSLPFSLSFSLSCPTLRHPNTSREHGRPLGWAGSVPWDTRAPRPGIRASPAACLPG